MKCPRCNEEMNEYWKVEFNYYLELDANEYWNKIKDNVKEEGFECFDCNLKIIHNGN